MIRRHYPLLRISPDAAGKLQYDHTRALARLAQIETELAELERQVRAQFGAEAYWLLRNNARNAALAEQLKQEIAA